MLIADMTDDTSPELGRGDRQQREPRHGVGRSGGGRAHPLDGVGPAWHCPQLRCHERVRGDHGAALCGIGAVPRDPTCGRPSASSAKLDHGAIFLFIAGSYTPFALGALTGPWGWTLLGLVWALAAVGVTLKALDRMRHPVLSTGFYLVMGWLSVFALSSLVRNAGPGALALILGGGVVYTLGVVFYLWTRLRFHHAIWHLFVLAGSTLHFFAVLKYVVP
jgi:hypothetical protein